MVVGQEKWNFMFNVRFCLVYSIFLFYVFAMDEHLFFGDVFLSFIYYFKESVPKQV